MEGILGFLIFTFSFLAAIVKRFPSSRIGHTKENKPSTPGRSWVNSLWIAAVKKYSDGDNYWERWAETTFKVPHYFENSEGHMQ